MSIIGEVVSAKVASWMIESGQTGSLFTIFTHHAKSTRSLLLSLRNSLLKEGSFQSERVALEQVTEVVRFDVHLHMSREGQRYIERISEIVPDTESPEGYRIVELVRFDGERYVKLHTISETTRAEMVKWLTKEEKEAFSMGYLRAFVCHLLLVFIRYDRKKAALDKDGLTGGEVRTLSVRVIGHLRKTAKILRRQWQKWRSHIQSHFPQNIPMCVSMAQCVRSSGRMEIYFRMDILSFREICSI